MYKQLYTWKLTRSGNPIDDGIVEIQYNFSPTDVEEKIRTYLKKEGYVVDKIQYELKIKQVPSL